jgi:hypothetical protein
MSTRTLTFSGADLRTKALAVDDDKLVVDATGNVQVGTANLFVDTQTGRVGVGMTNPEYKLDVNGTVQLNDIFTINSSVGNIKKKIFTHYNGDGSTRYWKVASGNYDGTRRNAIKMVVNIQRVDSPASTHRLVMLADVGTLVFFPCIDENRSSNPSLFPRDLRVYKNTSDTTFDIYIQASSYTYVEVDVLYSGSNITLYDTPTWTTTEPTTSGTYTLEFTNGNLNAMKIDINGNVGIGTDDPIAKFHVNGVDGRIWGLPVRSFDDDYALTYNATAYYGDPSVSIWASGKIFAGDVIGSVGGTITASDERIKTNITDINDGDALATLRLLNPKKYQYKDTIKRGTEPVWGFIAQEVANTLPYSTQTTINTLPNIYEMANVFDSNVITFTNFDTSSLESNASVIKVNAKDGTDHLVKLVEVINEHTIRVGEDLSEWIGSIDENGNVVAGNQLFIYGQEVDDFVFLKKDAIWTVATAALQEVDRQLQDTKAQLASVLARLDALEGNA